MVVTFGIVPGNYVLLSRNAAVSRDDHPRKLFARQVDDSGCLPKLQRIRCCCARKGWSEGKTESRENC